MNGPVKPVGQAAIKFMYTDWMNPRSTNSNMVTIIIIIAIIVIIAIIAIIIRIIVMSQVALDRMVGDYAFTCPVVNFAHHYARASPPNEYFDHHTLH